jgi:hypothetical protein
LGIESTNGVFDGYNFRREPIPEMQQMQSEVAPDFQMPFTTVENDGSFISMQDAAAFTPNDPESSLWTKDDKGDAVEITGAVLRDVEGKLAFMLGTTAGLVNVIDPICGGAFVQSTPQIARTLTPIICQSPGIVQWFQKTSNVILYINLAMACWPVAAAVYTHHFAKHQEENTNDFVDNGQMNINPNMYRVS